MFYITWQYTNDWCPVFTMILREAVFEWLQSNVENVLERRTDCTIFRSSRPEVFCKKVFLEILQNSLENTCARASFFKQVQIVVGCALFVVDRFRLFLARCRSFPGCFRLFLVLVSMQILHIVSSRITSFGLVPLSLAVKINFTKKITRNSCMS